MSKVTNLIVTFPVNDADIDDEILVEINKHINSPGELVFVGDCCTGGSKYLEINIAIGAFNHLNIDDFLKGLRSMDGNEALQVFYNLEEDNYFQEVRIR
jgi:hypothetical protein